ncbi:hypothetical protein KSP39_PZI017420 [Platanthera zijinensis]|uniref:Uncharacterized protein n=1 Tax=Platanthera zijinensis TaxID=2320716 RepID=A0AAP0B549_9ASPA
MRKSTRPSSFAAGDYLPTISPPPALPRRAQSLPLLSYSSVPFSWEHEPGVAKNPRSANILRHPDPGRIPLPPPIRFDSRNHHPDSDPFAAALAECAKELPPADPELRELLRRGSSAIRKRTAGWSSGGGLSLLGLYGSCKAAAAACSVVDSTIPAPRSRSVSRRLG